MLEFSWTITQEVENFIFFNLKIKYFSPKKQGGEKSENSVGLWSFKFAFTFEMLGCLAGGLPSTCWSFLSGMFYSSSPSLAEAMLATADSGRVHQRRFCGCRWKGRGQYVWEHACGKRVRPRKSRGVPIPFSPTPSMNTHTRTYTHTSVSPHCFYSLVPRGEHNHQGVHFSWNRTKCADQI